MFELRPYRKSSVSYYNPFREMADLERSFWGDPDSRNALAEFKTDITDEGDHFLLEADMPGFDKKDIHLDVNGDTLTIHAERKAEQEEKDDKNNYVRCERSFGSYSRQFDLSGVDADHMKATYDNGVLKLEMPKKALPDSARHIEIE
jgi:HSP20 family protein